MCLAIYAPKKTDKNSQFLFDGIRTAAITNDDGMGFAFKRASTKKVFISKGYTEVGQFIEAIKKKKLKDEDELIVHLRIGNKGHINTNMCHPFVASTDPDEVLSNDRYVDKPVFIHNGTLFKYSVTNSSYSDTYFFAKDFASNESLMWLLKNDINTFKKYLTDHISTSRFAFLFPHENTNGILLGDYTEDNGYFFSNDTYKNSRVRNVGGFSEAFDSDYDYCPSYYGGRSGNVAGLLTDKSTNNNFVENKIVDSSIDMPDDFPTTVYSDPITNVKFSYYMGLWIPAKHSQLQIRIDPTGMNYQHLVCTARDSDSMLSIIKHARYQIADWDFDEDLSYKYHQLTIFSSYGQYNHLTKVCPHNDLLTRFEIIPKPSFSDFYIAYKKLVANLAHDEKTLKIMTNIINNLNTSKEIQYENLGKFSKEVLELYQYNLLRHIYPGRKTFKEKYLEYCFN